MVPACFDRPLWDLFSYLISLVYNILSTFLSFIFLIIFSLKFARLKSTCPSASTRISLQSSLSNIQQALHYRKLVAMKSASTPLLPLVPSLPSTGKPTNSAFSPCRLNHPEPRCIYKVPTPTIHPLDRQIKHLVSSFCRPISVLSRIACCFLARAIENNSQTVFQLGSHRRRSNISGVGRNIIVVCLILTLSGRVEIRAWLAG